LVQGGENMILPTVSIGKKVKIKNVDRVEPTLRKRLISYGIKKDSVVCIKQKSLFSGAYIIECEGCRIGLRKRDLMNIEVEDL